MLKKHCRNYSLEVLKMCVSLWKEIEAGEGHGVNFSRSSKILHNWNLDHYFIDELPAWCMFSLATYDFGHFSSMWLEAVSWLDNSLNLTSESELWPSLLNFDLWIEKCPGIYSVLFVFYWKLISGTKWKQYTTGIYIYIWMSLKQHLLINKDRRKKKPSSHIKNKEWSCLWKKSWKLIGWNKFQRGRKVIAI